MIQPVETSAPVKALRSPEQITAAWTAQAHTVAMAKRGAVMAEQALARELARLDELAAEYAQATARAECTVLAKLQAFVA